VRDTRGFAVKLYTDEGNFDLVGNNIPAFFIQDGIKFPDVVHALKPEPHNEIPQAQSAHDTFWDFMSLTPETTHHTLWNMSDRGIPRSYRMMEGFGVHTFRLIAADGTTRLVKFHWKPLLGVHGLAWDEAQELGGRDPDFHRRDLWEAIERGAFPEWELGLQVVEEEQVQAFGFDLLDATKLLPEELVPVERVGRLRLDRNPDDFFAETEQVAFHLGNIVPGIDASEDPLLQARLFSYLDTQLTRLGGPNFAQIPINRPLAPVTNHQQDGFHQHAINVRRANYHPNSIEDGQPVLSDPDRSFVSAPVPLEGPKTRQRSESFLDHFTQPATFVASLTDPERDHLTEALRVELGRVARKEIRDRVVNEILVRVDPVLASDVAEGIGVRLHATPEPRRPGEGRIAISPALRMVTPAVWPIAGRRIAVLVADGVSGADVATMSEALTDAQAMVDLVADTLMPVTADDGTIVVPTWTFLTASSVQFDAVVVVGGERQRPASMAALEFVAKAWRHCKPLAFTRGREDRMGLPMSADGMDRPGVAVVDPALGVLSTPAVDSTFAALFVEAVGRHRFWQRQASAPIESDRT
jgi:catalase